MNRPCFVRQITYEAVRSEPRDHMLLARNILSWRKRSQVAEYLRQAFHGIECGQANLFAAIGYDSSPISATIKYDKERSN
jgi:hypothetical protein